MSYPTGLTPTGLPLTNDPAQTDSVSSTTRTQASSHLAPRSAAAAEIATDSAKVSLAGAMLSEASSGSDVRFDKVAALRQSIDAGTYSVPASDVASRLVDSLLK